MRRLCWSVTIPCSGRCLSRWSWGRAKWPRKKEAFVALRTNLGRFKLLARGSVKVHPESWIKQLIICFFRSVSESGACNSLVKQSRNGDSHLSLRRVSIRLTSWDLVSISDKPSGICRSLKKGWLEALGALKHVWITVIEKPLEWRIFASWIIGLMQPCNGSGNRITCRPLLFSIEAFSCLFFSI